MLSILHVDIIAYIDMEYRRDEHRVHLILYHTTFDEDMHRVYTLIGYGVNPFVMVYRGQDGSEPGDRRLKHLARWANRPALRKAASWEEYARVKRVTA